MQQNLARHFAAEWKHILSFATEWHMKLKIVNAASAFCED